ncbi:MurR/RpiR family transcriptional regulator [Aureimonas fodinaquatilis]|uniref:MurR/RpiR family transcriptional regulator n=1 Tax=Aureimonas fodinaquatilis TaxID=2565783 RepID=A0A5B0DV02_9HYPH|nr:MurR/RpiR family transcriptional regulator [Aureimonas fodinaquatilis]KAA0969621.1 MurR/RpiR family transcriptional regulator [Aureimonas fodinaquatilis]
MRVPVSILDRIRDGLRSFSKAEHRVAEVILRDSDTVSRLAIKDLAAAAQTSEPTVMRFVRRLGCDGFPDFKRRLSQDVAIASMFVFSDDDAPPQKPDDVAFKVYDTAAQALAYAYAQRDSAALEKAANAIDTAERVFCMGVGGSSANLAAEAENRLFRYDVHVSTIVDPYRQRMAAGLCTAKDVLVIFSVTGRPASLVDSAEAARANGATVITITRPQSDLAAMCTVLLPLDIPDHERHVQIPHRSRYGQLFVLDCLTTMVATRRLEKSAPKLRRLRAMLIAHHGPTSQQPIGD